MCKTACKNRFVIGKVTSADKADVRKTVTDIDTHLNGDNLTEVERNAVEAPECTARAMSFALTCQLIREINAANLSEFHIDDTTEKFLT